MPLLSPRHRRVEHGLFALLLLLLVAPLILTMVLALVPHAPAWAGWLDHPWLRNRTFMGIQVEPKPVAFSWPALRDATFQKSLGTQFDHHFAGREMLIRWTNEAYYRAFNQSATKYNGLALGTKGSILEDIYLNEYFLERVEKRELAPLVDRLRELQDFCRARGMGFVVLLTPSKVAAEPDDVPAGWARRYDPRPRAYEQLAELFREKQISHVDSVEMVHQMRKTRSAASIFPIGGIHWSAPVALDAANAMIAQLKSQGVSLQEIKADRTRMQDPSHTMESDVLDLANLALPWHYSYTTIRPHIAHTHGARKPAVVVVGGSFTHPVLVFLTASTQVLPVSFYFYYKMIQYKVQDGWEEELQKPVKDFDFERDIFHADALVLELNEQQMPDLRNSLWTFVNDALAHRPKPPP